ncbi:putative hydrolase of the HAD superfamily [bacterium A37T11]|nr:putative hydrolase of the HAD superfamily [bacterium A37T11]
MPTIENIIFDYGNVIFDIDFYKTKKAFTQLGIPENSNIFIHGNQHGLFDALDKGEISPSGFRDGIRKLANNSELTDQQIDDAWNSLLVGIPKGNNELLLELKAKYRTFLLSNNNSIHYDWIIEYLNREYKVPDNSTYFEKDYYSHLLGMRKPQSEIFEFVIQKHQLNPKKTLFIDDLTDNLVAANKLGIQTALATCANDFKQLILSLKILH